MQCLSVFPVLICVFVDITYLILYGIDSALLACVVVIPSSHNIAASLFYYSVEHFILVVTTLRNDCKLTPYTIVKK